MEIEGQAAIVSGGASGLGRAALDLMGLRTGGLQ